MTTSTHTTTRVAALAATIAIVIAAALASDGSAADVRSLRYDVRFSPFAYLDLGGDGPTAGDVITAHDRLYAHGKLVGHDALACTMTDAATKELQCHATFKLPGGSVTAEFLGTQRAVKHLAVTGGTGRYAGTSGTATITESGRDDTGNTAVFLLH